MTATIRKPDDSTIKVEAKVKMLWWQEKGLHYTASGYGRRIPTIYMVRLNDKWRRVYVAQYSNAGTSYIEQDGAWWIVEDVK